MVVAWLWRQRMFRIRQFRYSVSRRSARKGHKATKALSEHWQWRHGKRIAAAQCIVGRSDGSQHSGHRIRAADLVTAGWASIKAGGQSGDQVMRPVGQLSACCCSNLRRSASACSNSFGSSSSALRATRACRCTPLHCCDLSLSLVDLDDLDSVTLTLTLALVCTGTGDQQAKADSSDTCSAAFISTSSSVSSLISPTNWKEEPSLKTNFSSKMVLTCRTQGEVSVQCRQASDARAAGSACVR